MLKLDCFAEIYFFSGRDSWINQLCESIVEGSIMSSPGSLMKVVNSINPCIKKTRALAMVFLLIIKLVRDFIMPGQFNIWHLKLKTYNVFNTSFILLTASALLLKAACSVSFNLKSSIFSQPFFPMITGTPRQISF